MGNKPKITKALTMNKISILLGLLLVAFAISYAEAKVNPSCRLAVSKNGRCGPAHRHTRCPGNGGVYCSKWGWCGTSATHKRYQVKLYNSHHCGKKRAPPRIVKSHNCKLRLSRNGRCVPHFHNTRCARRGQFCSRWNWCGKTRMHRLHSQKRFNYIRCAKQKRAPKHRGKRIVRRFKFR